MDKKELGTIIHSVLKPLGFKKKGLVWTLTGEEISERIWLQKSCYGDFYYFHYDYVINAIQEYPSQTHVFVLTEDDQESYRDLMTVLNMENDILDESRKRKLTDYLETYIVPKTGMIKTEQQLKEDLIRRKWAPISLKTIEYLHLPEHFNSYEDMIKG